MNYLQEKLNKCNECPFENYEVNWYNEDEGTGKLAAYSYPESDNTVMIVGQNPSHRRWKGVHAMSGKQGDIFREIFGEKHLVFTNLIQVSTPDNKVDHLTNEQIDHCIKHLIDEIIYYEPKLIIVCSSFAKRKLVELNHNLCVYSNANVKFVKHPDYYFTYNRGSIDEYYKELKDIKETCINFI